MIHYCTLTKWWMFDEYLEYWGRDFAGTRMRVVHYEDFPERTHFDRGTYVLSTLEELGPALERLVTQVHARLTATPGVRIMNDPRRVLRRFDLHAELSRLGRNDYRSVRASGDVRGLRYPLFVRAERAHDGAISPLLYSEADVETWIGRAIALGRPLHDLMVVEFCDTADADGWYRKYAAFRVGKRIIPRSLTYGQGWMLKFAGGDFSQRMMAEQLDYVRSNPHETELAEIFEIAGIDYGRIDYSLKNGRVQTWEINLNPTIGRGSRPSSRALTGTLKELREETKREFYARFNAAWQEIVSEDERILAGATERDPVPLPIDPQIILAAQHEVRRGRRSRENIVKAGVRFVKPMMKTIAAPLLRSLYRLPKRLVTRHGASLFRVLGRKARSRV